MLLLSRERSSAPELARRFEVSRRTISRDLEDLCRAGIPVVTAQGTGGGVWIDPAYKLSHTFFTAEEVQAILAGLGGLDSVSKTPYLEKTAERFSGRGSPVIADGLIEIDLASHYREPLSEKIALLKSAAAEHRPVSFTYYYAQGEGRRAIEPYRLIFRWSSWYVFGWCPLRRDWRLFKLNRLWDLAVSDGTFVPREIPEGADTPERYFSSPERYHLHALFDAREKYRLIEEYGPGSFRERGGDTYPGWTGTLELERDFVSYDNMRAWILGFGDRARVLSPPELVADIARQAQNILSRETH